MSQDEDFDFNINKCESEGDKMERPSIPADIRRRVLVEAGHRCAIPTCRSIMTDIHHIIPWEECHEHTYENLISLCPNCHRLVHEGKIDRKFLRIYKANLRYTHDRFSQLEVDILFECYRASKSNAIIPWAEFLLLMIKRLLECQYVSVRKGSVQISFGGLNNSPVYLYITDKGRSFVESLGLEWAENPLQ